MDNRIEIFSSETDELHGDMDRVTIEGYIRDILDGSASADTMKSLAVACQRLWNKREEFVDTLNAVYSIAAAENPSAWRDEILDTIEVALFGHTVGGGESGCQLLSC